MPRLLSESEVRLEWSDILGRKSKRKPKTASVRSSGTHLSGIIKYALETAGLLQPDDESDEMPLRMAVGMAWEEWAVGLYPDLVWQPGEVHLDGVYGSPDGLSDLESVGFSQLPDAVVEEFKATWRSQRNYGKVTDVRLWMWQLAGYCRMMGLNHARLHVLWVNGDYRPPSPQYRTYLIEFPQPEIERFWKNVVLANRDKAKREEH